MKNRLGRTLFVPAALVVSALTACGTMVNVLEDPLMPEAN